MDFQKIIKTLEDFQTTQSQSERHRLLNIKKNKAKRNQSCVQGWSIVCRSMANDRAPWFVENAGQNYWKQDERENMLRQKLRLKINYEFTDHREASEAALCSVDQTEEKLKAREIDIGNLKLLKGLVRKQDEIDMHDLRRYATKDMEQDHSFNSNPALKNLINDTNVSSN
eukprot:UN32237